MMSDDEFDNAVKDIARTALQLDIPREALREYANREARAFCKGEHICTLGMTEWILDHIERIHAARKRKALGGEPVMFRRDYDGEPTALLLARPGPLQVLDLAAYNERYGMFDMDVSAWIDQTTPLDPKSAEAVRLKTLLETKGIQVLVVDEPSEEMDEIRHARGHGELPDEEET